MNQLLPSLDRTRPTPLYRQLYEYLKNAVTAGDLSPGERLPALRTLAKELGVSVTTIEQAYAQLVVEGYVANRPQSGYYVRGAEANPSFGRPPASSRESSEHRTEGSPGTAPSRPSAPRPHTVEGYLQQTRPYLYDITCFDYPKWKKCYNAILNDYPEQLLFESDPQGEEALRYEISRYVYASRGVRCSPERVVIAAGTQQISAHISGLLRRRGIANVAVEHPGYAPVRNTFRDHGFALFPIDVTEEGIRIEKLPVNLPAAAYVNPSNQFPSGAVMPIDRRYALLDWAETNASYIIEDDYDSELRYFGRPIPALQGLDGCDRVIYLGSFSSTLFPAAKISYMVLPEHFVPLFAETSKGYTQSCSKVEQLALALFMERGYYRKGIAKLRRLYATKLQRAVRTLSVPDVTVQNTASGISLLLSVQSGADEKDLCRVAATCGVEAFALAPSDTAFPESAGPDSAAGKVGRRIGLYYTRIPLADMENTLRHLLEAWQALA